MLLRGHFILNRFVGIGAVQQDQARGAHVQADLRIPVLIQPSARTQPLAVHLNQGPGVDVLGHIGELIPAAHAHPQRLFARTGLAVDVNSSVT